jgi:nucleoside-diphosphate-sugar epimerase
LYAASGSIQSGRSARSSDVMKILVTGSSGHLGEGLMRVLHESPDQASGLDIVPSPFTDQVGSILDREFVRRCLRRIDVVIHTATLHKPHLTSHTAQAFVDTNITGTLTLLSEAAAAGVAAFVFTSTTSAFGDALSPSPGAPAVWVTEDLRSVPKNMYGVTKVAAEDLCELFHRRHGLACVVLRTSRFFPDADDDPGVRAAFDDTNAKANEYLYRRVDLGDAVDAHLRAMEHAPRIGFGRYIVSATSPFQCDDLAGLRVSAAAIARRRVPDYEEEYARRGWTMPPTIDRVYINERARRELCWRPAYDFARVVALLRAGREIRSPLARAVGWKGYGGRK